MEGEEGARKVREPVTLPGGRVLVVREVTEGDAAGLQHLYAGLDAEARHRRFFSAYRPDEDFVHRMTSVAERGGCGLVAVVRDVEGGEELVGEAFYGLLANGDGELSLTVDDTWRGWLGPYLLDALVEQAAQRGVPNLEGDVLLTNRPMLALARARGCGWLVPADWSMQRVIIGTDGSTPAWPAPHERRRVLVEGAGLWPERDRLGAEADLIACPGPLHRRRPCPVLEGRPCPLVAGADLVIVHPTDAPAWQDLLKAHPDVDPGAEFDVR